jgi:hypothetical protein
MRDFNDLAAEESEAAGYECITLFEQIAQNSLCAGESGSGDAQRHLVFGLKDPAQQLGGFFEDAEKLRIDVTKLGR